MARPTTEISLKKQVKKDMKELGIYNSAYDEIIDVYVGLMFLYQKTWKAFKDSGYQVTEATFNSKGFQIEKKSELLKTIESLRKDIAIYSDRLGLNPKTNGINVTTKNDEGGGLDDAIAKLMT